MQMNMEVNSQEVKDYKLLYEMFGDKEYKDKIDELTKTVKVIIETQIKEEVKYLMVSNPLENNGIRYSTVVVVEDVEKTVNKILSLLNDLGDIEWVKENKEDGCVEFKIKDSYHLHMFNYTEGVI
ncbi:hypothetical protein ACI3ER_11785 [Bacillus sp. Wb]